MKTTTNMIAHRSGKFDLMDYMSDILEHFCKSNNLEFASADEISWETHEQMEWIHRFIEIWDRLSDRDSERWQRNQYLENPTPWSEYKSTLDIPSSWVDLSYSNDTMPSFSDRTGEFRIWINAPTLAERQVNYLDIGFKNLKEFKDWRLCVQRMDPWYEEQVGEELYFDEIEDAIHHIATKREYLKTELLEIGDRVRFGEDTYSICGRDEFDISGLCGTVVNFSENQFVRKDWHFKGHSEYTEVWIELDKNAPKEIRDAYEEWGFAVQFMLTDDNNGGTDYAYLKKATMIGRSS